MSDSMVFKFRAARCLKTHILILGRSWRPLTGRLIVFKIDCPPAHVWFGVFEFTIYIFTITNVVTVQFILVFQQRNDDTLLKLKVMMPCLLFLNLLMFKKMKKLTVRVHHIKTFIRSIYI